MLCIYSLPQEGDLKTFPAFLCKQGASYYKKLNSQVVLGNNHDQ